MNLINFQTHKTHTVAIILPAGRQVRGGTYC